jgi:hypothetical protein
LLRHQNPKIHELPELGTRQDDSALARHRVACVCSWPPIEEVKGIEETLRDMERIEFTVSPQGDTVWQSLNHFIATKAQDRGNPMFGQWTVRSADGGGLDVDRGSTDLHHIVPPERVNEAPSRDEELSLPSGPFTPEFAVRAGIRPAIQRIRVEPLVSLISGRKRGEHTVVVDKGEHAPPRQVALDSTEQFPHRSPEPLAGRAVLVLAKPCGARGLPVTPDSAASAFRHVVRAPQSLRAAKEVLCVAVEQLVRSRDSETEWRYGDTGANALINRGPALCEVVAIVGHNPSDEEVRDAGQVGAALDRRIEERSIVGGLIVWCAHRASIARRV